MKSLSENEAVDPKDVSVVVQGAVDRHITPKTLKSIRAHLPKATIILSTWKGEDVFGLDYDILIENDDPGAFQMNVREQNNVKRQICSTRNGILAASGKYVLKLRSDLVLQDSGFLKYFGRFNAYDSDWKFVKNRILASTIASRHPERFETAFCLSDWVFFGDREDMLNLWSAEYPTEEEQNWFNQHLRDLRTIYKQPSLISRFNPEQHILIDFLKRNSHADIAADSMFDNNPAAAVQTLHSIVNNFVLLSPRQYGFRWMKKTKRVTDRWHIFTHAKWLREYNRLANGRVRIPLVDWEQLSYLRHFWLAKKRLIAQRRHCARGALRRLCHPFSEPWRRTDAKKSGAPLMTVVIPTHNRLALLRQTLESLCLQTSRNFDVVIADDSPQPETRKAIESLAHALLGRAGIDFKYIFTSENLGQVKNTNQALQKAAGKYVRILHDDDVLHPHAIKEEIALMEKYDGRISCLFHKTIAFTQGMPVFKAGRARYRLCKYDDLVMGFLHTGCAVPSAMVFPRDVLEQIGLMNDSFVRACDWDFFYRLVAHAKENGRRVICVKPRYLGYRKGHADSNTNRKDIAMKNFLEYDTIMATIAGDLPRYGFSSEAINYFIAKSTEYRYLRMLREVKSMPPQDAQVFKDMIFDLVANTNDLDSIFCWNSRFYGGYRNFVAKKYHV
ncbi:MAG: glycosyltransferase [Alphaproteobacteria bacterium]|nr:glycosyltransferase [Alphaproteobacteria bacterium]